MSDISDGSRLVEISIARLEDLAREMEVAGQEVRREASALRSRAAPGAEGADDRRDADLIRLVADAVVRDAENLAKKLRATS